MSLEALAEASDEFEPTLEASVDTGDVMATSSTTDLVALAYDVPEDRTVDATSENATTTMLPSPAATTAPSNVPDNGEKGDDDEGDDADDDDSQRPAPTRRGSGMAIFKRLFSFR